MVCFCFTQRIRVALTRNLWISVEIITMLPDKRINNINERNVILSSSLFYIFSVALTMHRISNRMFFFLRIKPVQRRQTTYVANRINISLKCILRTRGLERIGYICMYTCTPILQWIISLFRQIRYIRARQRIIFQRRRD